MAPLAECALVVSPYEIEGERAGTIGVLGSHPDELPPGLGRRCRRGPSSLRPPDRGLAERCRPTTTSCSASPGTPPRKRSSAPIADSPASSTPTRATVTPNPRRGSRRSPTPTRCCPTPRSASATTPTAPRAWRAAPLAPIRSASAAVSATCSRRSSAPAPSGAAGVGRPGRPGARTSRQVVELEFEEAVFGSRASGHRQAPLWPATPARRRAPPTAPSRSPASSAGGTGQVQRVRQSFIGQMVTSSPCARCGGSGQVIANPCAGVPG